MIAGLAFAFWRWTQIITLIPTLGMLAYFVRGYTSSNMLTPDFILVLFITSVLAAVWAIATVFAYHRAKHSAIFVSFVDFCFMASFIASVVVLRKIAQADCSDFTAGSFYVDLGVFGAWGRSWDSEWSLNVNKNCAMLKACFAFGIMNIFFFFFTAILALFIHRKHRDEHRRETHSHSHSSRHGHRRSGSRHSHHSHHSRHSQNHQRPYY
ncbi:MAG: hypothetical protein M1815_003338 [Lichina confinis]|nr:MAG: hypothetical protein M1815_003338 [Lichina confinis]